MTHLGLAMIFLASLTDPRFEVSRTAGAALLEQHLNALRWEQAAMWSPAEVPTPSPDSDSSMKEDEKSAKGEVQEEGDEAVLTEEDWCESLTVTGSQWIDKVNRGLHRAVCESALWFDGLFGDRRLLEDREATYGRILLGLHGDERDGLEDFTNFEAKLSFPNLERRLNAFVGRGDRERIVTGQGQIEEYVPPAGLEDDEEWLIGLGYSPAKGRRSKTSFDVGVDLGFPMNPFVKARYRHRFFSATAAWSVSGPASSGSVKKVPG